MCSARAEGRKWEIKMWRKTKLEKKHRSSERETTERPSLKQGSSSLSPKKLGCEERQWNMNLEIWWREWSAEKDLNRTSDLNQRQMSVLAHPSPLMSQRWCSQHLSSSSFLFPLFFHPSAPLLTPGQLWMTTCDDSSLKGVHNLWQYEKIN